MGSNVEAKLTNQVREDQPLSIRSRIARATGVIMLATGVGTGVIAPETASTQSPCDFQLGFKTLHDMIPQSVGECLDNEHHNPKNGDGLQHTTGGLLVWRKTDNWTAFTDGYRTWINGPRRLQVRLNTQRFAWEADVGAAETTLIVEPGTWSPTGSMRTARVSHTATLLPNGKVLVVGGDSRCGGCALASAELYDPAIGTWSDTGNAGESRLDHTATLLPNGLVLVTGGFNGDRTVASAELFDPKTGIWSPTGSMRDPRASHVAVLLTNGKVLVAGSRTTMPIGSNRWTSEDLASAELYDPATGNWTPTEGMTIPRVGAMATLLPDDRVLVAGGINGIITSAELYDPETGMWTATGDIGSSGACDATSALLPSGLILWGGRLYNPNSGTWETTGVMNTPRGSCATAQLADGRVLVAGGSYYDYKASAEIYDPSRGVWTATGNMQDSRDSHSLTVLPSGLVLVAGGRHSGGYLKNAELYTP